jgi:hypothetical protein
MEAAIEDYAAGRRSAWSAAESAGVALYELLDRIAEAGIPYSLDPEALDRLRGDAGLPPSGAPPANPAPHRATSRGEAAIGALGRDTGRPRRGCSSSASRRPRAGPTSITPTPTCIAPRARRSASACPCPRLRTETPSSPIRQWRPVYVGQLAGIVADVLGTGATADAGRLVTPAPQRATAIAESTSAYGQPGQPGLHEVMAGILRRHGNAWLKASVIA